MAMLTEACEKGLCGNCYKGQDQMNGWCECSCHPAAAANNFMARLRRNMEKHKSLLDRLRDGAR